ncbi:hypothetical protein D1164_23180 [Mariniphaga sediminis]|uniref:Uncharacterized protein n=1 Tax=Mariniphaga sediminis TaxID=1628158 RepID=A0A399CUE9_9BACT|nr:hypothetical protein D1164_23180 [Mariniphaga sediminis]
MRLTQKIRWSNLFSDTFSINIFKPQADFTLCLEAKSKQKSRGCVRMRTLRALFNSAVKREIIKTEIYPFTKFQNQRACLSKMQVFCARLEKLY